MIRLPIDETLPIDARADVDRDARILVVSGERAGLSVPLPSHGEWTVGRDPGCDLVLDEPSLSRRHATLRIARGGVSVVDLGSKNGTHVGDVALRPGEPSPLSAGARALLGRVSLVLLDPPERRRLPPSVTERDHDLVVTPYLGALLSLVERAAATDLPVLVVGETGTGKDVVAEHLHLLSRRAEGPLVRIHPASLGESVFESELFGHEQGAFTGAQRAKPGLLETAHGGTVFLDEIAEIQPSAQAKLLRVLEDRRVQRVGSLSPRRVDVRFVAATHRDLRAAVGRGQFREDLYQRLRGIEIRLPPLRERRADVVPLAEAFLARVARGVRLGDRARAALLAHPFPGNVRELRLAVERAAALTLSDTIDEAALDLEGTAHAAGPADGHEDEAARIAAALEKTAGNQTAAAKLLGISRRTLVTRLGQLGLPRPRS